MSRYPAVIVHGMNDARRALEGGLPATLLSARGAGIYAGCLWWRGLIAAARGEYPDTPFEDILDCADAPGRALAALRAGQRQIVLSPKVTSYGAVRAAAETLGAEILPARPPALDLREPAAAKRLLSWLNSRAG